MEQQDVLYNSNWFALPHMNYHCESNEPQGNLSWTSDWNSSYHNNTQEYNIQYPSPLSHMEYMTTLGYHSSQANQMYTPNIVQQQGSGSIQSIGFNQWVTQNAYQCFEPLQYNTDIANWKMENSPRKLSLPPSPTCGTNNAQAELFKFEEEGFPFIDDTNLNLLADEVLNHSNLTLSINQQQQSITETECMADVSNDTFEKTPNVTTCRSIGLTIKKKKAAEGRKTISDLVKQLNGLLPYAACHHLRTPRITTLEKAIEFIDFMHLEIRHSIEQLRNLKLKSSCREVGPAQTQPLRHFESLNNEMSSLQVSSCSQATKTSSAMPQCSITSSELTAVNSRQTPVFFDYELNRNNIDSKCLYGTLPPCTSLLANNLLQDGRTHLKEDDNDGVTRACEFLKYLIECNASGKECRQGDEVLKSTFKSQQYEKGKSDEKKIQKKPMNAFMYFAKLNRTKLHKRYSSFDNRQVSKLLGQAWQSLNETCKREYRDMAKQAREIVRAERTRLQHYETEVHPEVTSMFGIVDDKSNNQSNGATVRL